MTAKANSKVTIVNTVLSLLIVGILSYAAKKVDENNERSLRLEEKVNAMNAQFNMLNSTVTEDRQNTKESFGAVWSAIDKLRDRGEIRTIN